MSLPIISENELLSVSKPGQYLGGERGSVIKTEEDVELRVCLAFPDTYEVGMSHVGYQILYDLINRDDRMWAERVYSPLPDMEKLLRGKGASICSLESKRPLAEFDVVGFSLQYELCMNGILSILDLGSIPLLAADRTEEHPIVIGGGPVAYHPEPFADFFDAFLIGDGEELVPEFLNRVIELRNSPHPLPRAELLQRLAQIEGVYVPSLFTPQYDSYGRFTGMQTVDGQPTTVRRRVLATLEDAPYPTNPIVPNIPVVHDRLAVEVMRGCVRGCRFCQAGYLYRPQRERKPEEILGIVERSLENSGFEELSLLSLSTADYCSILPLLSALKEKHAEEDQLAISFPSTRVDALKPELLQEVQPIRRSGFTLAPEAGTQRLRDVINKGVTDEEIIATCKNVFDLGWNSVKLYFMIGLPTETDEDVYGILDIAKRVKALTKGRQSVTVSVSTLVPKPHTPFQWAEQIPIEEIIRRQRILFKGVRRLGLKFRSHEAESTFLEGVFARGDRKLGAAILRAYERGARLDGWVEELQFDLWQQAFLDVGIDPHHYLHEIQEDEPLPWDHISCDIPKRYFLKEWKRATENRTTPDCLTETCSVCGACDYDAKRNVLFDRKRTETRLQIIAPPWESIIEAREGSQGEPVNESLKESCKIDRVESAADAHQAVPFKKAGYTLKEYLRTETDTGSNAPLRPDIPVRQRIRCRYQKKGLQRFTAHLQLATVLFRSARRAEIPVAYSRGFHPKPRMSFGPPIQLGVESDSEFVDLFLTERLDPKDFLQRFNLEVPEGISFLEAREIPLKMKSIQATVRAQTYEASLDVDFPDRSILDRVQESAGGWNELIVQRTRKGKTREMPLSTYVKDLVFDGDKLTFTLVQDRDGTTFKPLEVLSALSSDHAELLYLRKTGTDLECGDGGEAVEDMRSVGNY